MGEGSKKRPNIEFDEINKKKPKEAKLESNILSLNNDCFYSIFDVLSLNDLCNVSRVCKRLKYLAENQFERTYSEKWKYIEPCERYSRIYTTKPTIDYVQCFKEHIQVVVLKGSQFLPKQKTYECPIKCLEFACSQTNSGYKQIQFTSFTFFNGISDDLCLNIWKKVESVGFSNCRIDEHFWNKMRFSDAGCLKNLMFQGGGRFNDGGYDIPHLRIKWIASINISQLEHFHYFSKTHAEYKAVHVQHLSSFLQRHPKLRSLAWAIDYFGFEDSVARQLDPIVNYGTALEQLFLKFSQKVNLEDVYSELKPLIDRVNFKRLEIELGDERTWQYTKKWTMYNNKFPLTKLTGLHYLGFPRYLSQIVTSLTNLQILHFKLNSYKYDMTEIARKLENLKELIFDDATDHPVLLPEFLLPPDTLESKFKIVPFVRYSSKLKKITLYLRSRKDNQGWDANTIHHFNEYRKELKDSKQLEDAKLEIFFGGGYYSEDFINSLHISQDRFLVKMKRVTLVCPVLNIKNPLVNFSYDSM